MSTTTQHNRGLVAAAAAQCAHAGSPVSAYATSMSPVATVNPWPTARTAAERPMVADFRLIGHKPGTRRLEEHPT
jgi:hypothetical protein